jgi:hypothetical protein
VGRCPFLGCDNGSSGSTPADADVGACLLAVLASWPFIVRQLQHDQILRMRAVPLQACIRLVRCVWAWPADPSARCGAGRWRLFRRLAVALYVGLRQVFMGCEACRIPGRRGVRATLFGSSPSLGETKKGNLRLHQSQTQSSSHSGSSKTWVINCLLLQVIQIANNEPRHLDVAGLTRDEALRIASMSPRAIWNRRPIGARRRRS